MNLPNALFRTISIMVSLCVVVGVLFCYQNRTGHTSLSPYWGLLFFGAASVMGFLVQHRQRWLTLTSGLSGIFLVLLVSQRNILNQYENWIVKGMPDRNPYADFWLTGFLLAYLGALVFSYRRAAKKEST